MSYLKNAKQPRDVVVLVGSLRNGSYTRMVAQAISDLAPPTLRLAPVPIGHLPHYNFDHEAAVPPEWSAFRDRLKLADAVLFATPEYNRSIPGALKNALDVGSRPYGQSVWEGKPAAVVSASTGAIGGFGANHALRQCLVFLNMPVLQQPEAYIGDAAKLFDADGGLTNDGTRAFLAKFAAAFAAWVELVVAKTPVTA